MYTGGAYLPAHSLTVRAVKEHPNTCEIVDRLHRFLAMQRIVKIFGVTGLAQMIGGGKDCCVNCTVLKHDTPLEILTIIAESQNEADSEHQVMTWVDTLVNLHQFAIATAACQEKQHWSALEHMELYNRACKVKHSTIRSYSDMQKKMGLVHALFSKTDDEALRENPLAYHIATTKRTAAMEIMIMDSMTHEALTRLTTQYVRDRQDNVILEIQNWNELLFIMWREQTMYPTVYTSDKSRRGPQRFADFYIDANHVRVANIMRTRMMFGISITKKLQSGAAMLEARAIVGYYIPRTPGAVECYDTMLKIAEPSGTLQDSPIFQAAQFAENTINDDDEEEKKSPDITVVVRLNQWPFMGHAGYKLDQPPCTDEELHTTQTTQGKQDSKRAEGEMPRHIAHTDLRNMAGMHVELDICQCGKPCNSYT